MATRGYIKAMSIPEGDYIDPLYISAWHSGYVGDMLRDVILIPERAFRMIQHGFMSRLLHMIWEEKTWATASFERILDTFQSSIPLEGMVSGTGGFLQALHATRPLKYEPLGHTLKGTGVNKGEIDIFVSIDNGRLPTWYVKVLNSEFPSKEISKIVNEANSKIMHNRCKLVESIEERTIIMNPDFAVMSLFHTAAMKQNVQEKLEFQ